jgi:hypothetical protein
MLYQPVLHASVRTLQACCWLMRWQRALPVSLYSRRDVPGVRDTVFLSREYDTSIPKNAIIEDLECLHEDQMTVDLKGTDPAGNKLSMTYDGGKGIMEAVANRTYVQVNVQTKDNSSSKVYEFLKQQRKYEFNPLNVSVPRAELLRNMWDFKDSSMLLLSCFYVVTNFHVDWTEAFNVAWAIAGMVSVWAPMDVMLTCCYILLPLVVDVIIVSGHGCTLTFECCCRLV